MDTTPGVGGLSERAGHGTVVCKRWGSIARIIRMEWCNNAWEWSDQCEEARKAVWRWNFPGSFRVVRVNPIRKATQVERCPAPSATVCYRSVFPRCYDNVHDAQRWTKKWSFVPSTCLLCTKYPSNLVISLTFILPASFKSLHTSGSVTSSFVTRTNLKYSKCP